jgi:hypothetical protein
MIETGKDRTDSGMTASRISEPGSSTGISLAIKISLWNNPDRFTRQTGT